MSRTEGAKNKIKSVSELLTQLKTAAEKEGKNFDYSLLDLAADVGNKPAVSVEKDIENAAKKAGLSKAAFESLELELEEGEIDTYRCGSCGETMASELPLCPNCNAKLNW